VNRNGEVRLFMCSAFQFQNNIEGKKMPRTNLKTIRHEIAAALGITPDRVKLKRCGNRKFWLDVKVPGSITFGDDALICKAHEVCNANQDRWQVRCCVQGWYEKDYFAAVDPLAVAF